MVLLLRMKFSFVVLWLTFSVIDCSETERRDIHRIIIRQSVPKNRGHRHPTRAGHSGYHKDQDSPEQEHSYYKYDHDSYEHAHSGDRENSFEDDVSFYKPRKNKRPHLRSSESEDMRQESSASASSEGWSPSASSPNGFRLPKRQPEIPIPKEYYTAKPKRIHEFVDITTEAPQRLPPPLFRPNSKRGNGMNYFNFKITQPGQDINYAEESRVKTTIDTSQRKLKKSQPQPKKVGGGYEVYEQLDDIRSPKPPSINVMSPYLVKSIPLLPTIPPASKINLISASDEKQRINTTVPPVRFPTKREKYGRRVKTKRERTTPRTSTKK